MRETDVDDLCNSLPHRDELCESPELQVPEWRRDRLTWPGVICPLLPHLGHHMTREPTAAADQHQLFVCVRLSGQLLFGVYITTTAVPPPPQ